MTFWRVASKARSQRVALEGMFQGCAGFLVGGSPRLRELDLRLLNLPGCWAMAINNAAVVFRPQAFIALDTALCFNFNIFSDQKVLKLFPYSRNSELVAGKRLCHYPNTLFFDLDDASQVMMSEFCRLNGPLPYWKNTFFTALAAMYQLGFMSVYLLGCTFDTSGGAYAFENQLNEGQKSSNQLVYDDAIERLAELFPMLSDEGMKIMTCHQGTKLDGICDFVSFDDAISKVVVEATAIGFNEVKHVDELRH